MDTNRPKNDFLSSLLRGFVHENKLLRRGRSRPIKTKRVFRALAHSTLALCFALKRSKLFRYILNYVIGKGGALSMARTKQTARTSTGGTPPRRTAANTCLCVPDGARLCQMCARLRARGLGRFARGPPYEWSSDSDSDRVRGQGESSPPRKRRRNPDTNSESESDQDSKSLSPRPDLTECEWMPQSELQRIRKEARDEAIKETEAKCKRKVQEKVQETFQCVVCHHIPKEGHIIQCQNGHLLCGECTNNNLSKACPNCRAPLDRLAGNKRIRNLAVEQLIESMDLTFPCKHPYCEFSASKNEAIMHEQKCKYRLVPCPDDCCKRQWPLHNLLEHMRFGKETDHVKMNDAGYRCRLNTNMENLKKRGTGWDCRVLNYQNQLFVARTHKVDGIFYTYVYILGDLEEAKKFKVAIAIGQGTQSGIIHTGQIFSIDAKQQDIIKEKRGVLSFSWIGMGETLFEDVGERKSLQVLIKISNAQDLNGGDTCKFGHSLLSISLGT